MSSKIESCQKEIAELQRDIADRGMLLYRAQKELEGTKILLREKQARLRDLQQTRELTISEHAILRYVERYYGLPLDAIKQKIVEYLAGVIPTDAPDGKYTIDGVTYVKKGSVIVTIIYNEMQNGN